MLYFYVYGYFCILLRSCINLDQVDVRNSMELGMEDIEENIEDIVDFSHKVLSNRLANIGFGVEMAKVSKEIVCSNYFEMDVDTIQIVN